MSGLIEKIEVIITDPRLTQIANIDLEALTKRNSDPLSPLQKQFRTCCLGIVGAKDDPQNTEELPGHFPDFQVVLERHRQSIKLILLHTPSDAFPKGKITEGKRRQLGAAIRDMLFAQTHLKYEDRTTIIHQMLRDADALSPTYAIIDNTRIQLDRITCFGGHRVGQDEYFFSKNLGKELGLAYMEVITGGGPGIMRGIMRGNVKGLRMQDTDGKQIGMTCPEIITAEPPNSWLNRLIILPDIESRLEAFLRTQNGIIFLPGGIGTLEEFMTVLAVKTDASNSEQELPLLLAGPRESMNWIVAVEEFMQTVFGKDVKDLYNTITGDPEAITNWMREKMPAVHQARNLKNDDRLWNNSLHIPKALHIPFEPTHKNVSELHLESGQSLSTLALEIRNMLKAIVFAQVVEGGSTYIQEHGKYIVTGERKILQAIDTLFKKFASDGRMFMGQTEPCYTLQSSEINHPAR